MQAQAEGSVTYVSNMWDTYFEGGRDHRLDRLSITQLPYYDGARLGLVFVVGCSCLQAGAASRRQLPCCVPSHVHHARHSAARQLGIRSRWRRAAAVPWRVRLGAPLTLPAPLALPLQRCSRPPAALTAGDYWPGEVENLLASITSEAAQVGATTLCCCC